MKQITIKNDRKTLLRSKLMVFLLVGFCLYLFVNQIVTCVKGNIDGLEDETVTIKETKYDESATYFYFTVNENNSTYYCTNLNVMKYFADNISLNLTTDVLDNPVGKLIYKIDCVSSPDMNYDNTEEFFATNTRTIIIASVIIAGMIGYLAYVLITIFKKPLEETFDAIEYQLTANPIITNKMLPKSCKTRKKVQLYNVVCGILLGSIMLILLFSNALQTYLGENFALLVYIYFGISLVVGGLLVIFRPQFDSKDSYQFSNDYLNYLNNGGGESFNLAYTFTNEGIKYSSNGEDKIYPYDKLNLYVTALYGKGFFATNLFIVSDIEDLGEKDLDIIIPLTYEVYTSLKDNNVKVKGLDELLHNLQKEITKYSPFAKKGKVVKYNN